MGRRVSGSVDVTVFRWTWRNADALSDRMSGNSRLGKERRWSRRRNRSSDGAFACRQSDLINPRLLFVKWALTTHWVSGADCDYTHTPHNTHTGTIILLVSLRKWSHVEFLFVFLTVSHFHFTTFIFNFFYLLHLFSYCIVTGGPQLVNNRYYIINRPIYWTLLRNKHAAGLKNSRWMKTLFLEKWSRMKQYFRETYDRPSGINNTVYIFFGGGLKLE